MTEFERILQIAYWISQILLVIAAFAAAFIAFHQIRIFASFELLRYIQDQKLRDARRIVLADLKSKSFQEWTAAEKEAASMAAASYSVLGRVLRYKFAPGIFFILPMLSSIIRSHQILEHI